MLASIDPKEENLIEFKAKRKQVELLLTVIDERVNEKELLKQSTMTDRILVRS